MGDSSSHMTEPETSDSSGQSDAPEQGTSTGIKRKVQEGSSDLDVLPLEMILEVFKGVPLEEVIRLGNETALLNSAARLHAKYEMLGLRRSISSTVRFITKTLRNLPMNKDHLRSEIVKSFYLTKYISTEVELLFASVWRYRDDEDAWNVLSPHLGPVVSEFERAISAQRNTETTKPDLTAYRMIQLLKEWYRLTEALDNGLHDTLDSAAAKKTPYEIRVIDMLMCTPSYCFQLALKRTAGKQQYDVYGFFKSPNLKPFGQVPDVFNSQLNAARKKLKLMSYLRETVQRENLNFVAGFFNTIDELERAQAYGNINENNRVLIMNRLGEEYQRVGETVYSPVLRKSRYRVPKDLYEEYYVRCPHENLSLTGLHCIVVAPGQEISNMPLAIPFLRGRRQKLYDHFDSEAMEGPADLSNLFPRFTDSPSFTALTSDTADAKPKLQLLIHYRESYVAGPSEVMVNIGYGNDDHCYVTFHNFHGEPLNPPQRFEQPIPPPP